jgi:hypothetical protein
MARLFRPVRRGVCTATTLGERKAATAVASQGSVPTGPSEQYLRLLKGQISPEEYAKNVKKRVRAQRQNGNSGHSAKSGAQRKPA